MKINEIFKSIQGEGAATGLPCVFVRTAFCNLRCRWCDTAYAFYDGEEQSIDSIVATVSGMNCRLVEITGGEPLLQKEVHPLMTRLLDEGYQVLLETSGSLPIHSVDPRVKIILDLKCPGSDMNHTIHWPNLAQLKPNDEVKFVIAHRDDFDWAKSVVHQHPALSDKTILFSPVFGELAPAELAEWILKEDLSVRLNMQIHKMIWAPTTQGV